MTEEAQTTAPAEPTPFAETPAPAPEPAAEPTNDAAPPADKPTFKSRRQAIEEAFAKDADTNDEGKTTSDPAKPAEDGPARGPDGKFVAKDGEKPATDAPQDGQKPADAAKAAEDGKSPLSEPPSRFSADAKAAWKDAPEPVKGEIKRAITELESGLRQKDEQLEPLKPYFDLAKQHGVTVHDTLGRYIQMEQVLRQNPQQGLALVAQRLGMTPQDMIQALGGQAPQGEAATANEKDRMIVSLRQEIDGLKSQIGQVSTSVQQSREQAVMQQVQDFAASKPRFAELEGEILRLLQTGYASDLADAYEKAERLNPAPAPAAPPPPTTPPPQTRPARSVTGAPTSGSNPANRQPSTTRREAILRAAGASGLA